MAPKLATLPNTASGADIAAMLERDGACIVDRLFPVELVDKLLAESKPYIDRTGMGGDRFAGFQTQRTGGLVARTKSASSFVAHPLILDTLDLTLGPYCQRYQLHLTQLIVIHPGQGAQLLHRDRQVWGNYLRQIEPETNLMIAMTDFSQQNGATRVVPGSHKWEWEREAKEEEIGYAEMKKGSVLFYSGSVIHSGGKNESNMIRIGLNVDYSVGWIRSEENQILSCPPEYAKNLEPTVQELIGYTMFSYTGGYFSFPDPKKAPLLPKSALRTGVFEDTLPPEFVLGRRPLPNKRITPNALAGQNKANPIPVDIKEPAFGQEAKLQTLPNTATREQVKAALDRDGAVIVANAMPESMVKQLLSEMDPYLNQSGSGADQFAGFKTRRTGAVVARSPAARDFVRHPAVLGACSDVLLPSCRKFQLHLTQLIAIGPGEKAQQLHRDRHVWDDYLPRDIEPELNVLWALTPYYRANGATRVVPGSHKWAFDRVPKPHEIGYAEMPLGSVLIYTGSVLHSGGANTTKDQVRIAMNVDYSLGWLKQEENQVSPTGAVGVVRADPDRSLLGNQYLSCPPEIAKDLPQDLTDLIGYTMADYVLGYYSLPDPFSGPQLSGSHLGSDTVPPEVALGRLPQVSAKKIASERVGSNAYGEKEAKL